ncbi:MAG TPA: hypothetical protein VJS88_03935, partial [Chthoniobacterales bacterium]|nr:hypothetical protein [Chthoniobacterales bacterium]
MRRIEWLLFLTLWFGYGALINSENLVRFGLQQAGVEAYVERHHFYLEGSRVAALEPTVVDSFARGGHTYPAKQPGQFMAGALVYFPLHALGLSYANNFLLTAALVTLLTASLVTAASVVAVFKTAREILDDETALFWPLLAALSYGLGSTMMAYSGLAWHDTLATGYLAIALYLVMRSGRTAQRAVPSRIGPPRGVTEGRASARPGQAEACPSEGSANVAALRTAQRAVPTRAALPRGAIVSAGVGLFLGLTLTTSMLPFFAVVVLALFFIASRRWNLLPAFFVGGLAGLAPLLLYNATCFGNPLLMP